MPSVSGALSLKPMRELALSATLFSLGRGSTVKM
jgi:hypothetical protein